MAKIRQGGCALSSFERRICCSRKKVSPECLKPWFLGYHCWYLSEARRT